MPIHLDLDYGIAYFDSIANFLQPMTQDYDAPKAP
jgi:hypothetical protein